MGLEPLGDSGGFVQQVEIERPETAAPPTLSVAEEVHARPGDRVQGLSAARVPVRCRNTVPARQ